MADRDHDLFKNEPSTPKCIFGGFTAAYQKADRYSTDRIKMMKLMKPIYSPHPYKDTGKINIKAVCLQFYVKIILKFEKV